MKPIDLAFVAVSGGLVLMFAFYLAITWISNS